MEASIRVSDKFRFHLNSTSFSPSSGVTTPPTGVKCGGVGDEMITTDKILVHHALQNVG